MQGPRFKVIPGKKALPGNRAAAPGAAPYPATPEPDHPEPDHPEPDQLASHLLQDGCTGAEALLSALALQTRLGGRLEDHLLAQGQDPQTLAHSVARFWGLTAADPATRPADPRLIAAFGALPCLQHSLLPWRDAGGVTVVLTSRPEEIAQRRPALTAALGPVIFALAPARAIEAALLAACGPDLAQRAETRTPLPLSCRAWRPAAQRPALVLAALAALLALWLAPAPVLAALLAWGVLTLLLGTGLKLAATFAALRQPPPEGPAPIVARLPTVSVMVALYKEATIAPRLVRRLSKLDYPPDRLDVLLVVEEHDHTTRAALARTPLPGWMRVVTVPEGAVKTKPRALNHALELCRGSIVGVYDAEDAPAPDQIRRVVQRFHERGPRVACLQGMLDFYNPRSNWLARGFTFEYASWFRLILPGLDRLGLPVPLGGTTLFFRRAALQDLGAWDAWNVTEDADLGMRLARRGWRTEVIATVTEEEANCRPIPWVKQRSRWLKGYAMTWLVHMRDPLQLWADLGPKGFFGFQLLFLCTLSQFVLAPLLWSFWALALGFAHPLASLLGPAVMTAILALFLLAEAISILINLIALRRTTHRLHPLWTLTLGLYFLLGALAVYKALWELVTRPFYWDKTSHGVFDGE